MTWAAVITMGVASVVRLATGFKKKGDAEIALAIAASLWWAALAYAIWDRYLP